MRYFWEIRYFLAILQTDEASRTRAVYEAIEAIEQRRLTPVNGAENVALMGAEAEIVTCEHTGVRTHRPSTRQHFAKELTT
jgi:hypothetical protein